MSLLIKPTNEKARRISTGMMKIEVTGSQQQQQQQQQTQQQQQQPPPIQQPTQQPSALHQHPPRPGTMRTGSLDHSSNMTVRVPSICMSPDVGRDRSLSPPRHSSVPCSTMPIITTASSISPPTSLALNTAPDAQRETPRHRLSTGSVAPKLAPIASCEILPEPSSSSEDEEEAKTKRSGKKKGQAPPKVIMTPTAAMERCVMGDEEKVKEKEVRKVLTV